MNIKVTKLKQFSLTSTITYKLAHDFNILISFKINKNQPELREFTKDDGIKCPLLTFFPLKFLSTTAVLSSLSPHTLHFASFSTFPLMKDLLIAFKLLT